MRPAVMPTEPAYMSWPLPEGHDGDAMWAWQAGRCGICGGSGPLVLDHDHRTNLVRGYLCRGCNNREGRATAHPLYIYWRSGWNPATLMGVVEEYVGIGTELPAVDEDEMQAAIRKLA